jgi:hypothetical protein
MITWLFMGASFAQGAHHGKNAFRRRERRQRKDQAVATIKLTNVIFYLVGFAGTGKLTIACEPAPLL